MIIADHTLPPTVAVDRALPGTNRNDNRAAMPPSEKPGNDPEPVNRRGRRFLEREIRRSQRSVSREARRRRIEELAGSNYARL